MLSLRKCAFSLLLATSATALPQRDDGLLACGEAFYSVEKVRIMFSRHERHGVDAGINSFCSSTLATMVISYAPSSTVCRR